MEALCRRTPRTCLNPTLKILSSLFDYHSWAEVDSWPRLRLSIDHGKAGRGLVDVAAYNPSTEANYVSAVNALRAVDFPLLSSQRIERSRLISKASSFYTMSISDVLKVGMPISFRITASIPYVSDNHVSPLLDLIVVRCAYKRCGTSSVQSLHLSSSHAFIPSPKLLFALSTKPLAYGFLTEAKRWRMHSFSRQSLNGLSLNCVLGGEPGNLDIPESPFLHPHALLASSILS
ncbi:hypothetical protein Tco_0017289, partial [Tanacetum coccineum]